MMRVDAAPGTEVVLGGHGVELIHKEQFLALEDTKTFQWDSTHDCAFPAAHGTSAAAGIDDAIWEIEFEDHAAAMTTGPVLWLNGRVTDLANRQKSRASRLTAEFSGGTPPSQHAGAQRSCALGARPPAAEQFMRPRPLQRFVRRHFHQRISLASVCWTCFRFDNNEANPAFVSPNHEVTAYRGL
jgi:hypothetical protein